MQQTKKMCAPPQLAAVVTEIVELSKQKASLACDASRAVDDLVSVSRWNPALLMVAAEQVRDELDLCADDQLELALEYLRAAKERVQRRAY